MHRWYAGSALAVAAALLAACGSTASSAPTESVSDSGSPAAWIGTKGVEVTVTNPSARSVYVGTRQNNDIQELKPGESRTYRGERSGADDLELFMRWASSGEQGLELDFSNPSIGYPNVTFLQVQKNADEPWNNCGSTGMRFSEGEVKTCDAPSGGWFALGIKRESDSSDWKRFTMGVCNGKSPRYSSRWSCQ